MNKEIAQDQRRKDREQLAALRRQIADLKRRRREAMSQAVARCKKSRIAVREHAKELRRQVREALRETIQREKEAARSACTLRKQRIRGAAMRQTDKVRELLRAERALQAQIRRVDQRSKKAETRSTAHERRQESDDAVRQNIDSELVPLFEKVKRQIRGNERMSRTEAFLRYVEENPGELIGAMEEDVARELRDLEREAKRLRKTSPRPRRATAEELAAVPF